MMIENLSQLKKVIGNKPEFEIIDHCKPQHIGQIRKVNIIQTNGCYSIIPSKPDSTITLSNRGKGIWFAYGKASFWQFKDGICSLFNSLGYEKENLIISFRIIQ